MLGLIVLAALIAYLVLWAWVTRATYRWAKARGYSASKRWAVTLAVFLVMYLIPFWDWIPTVVAHRHYCNKEAGFFMYKTLEQWKAENPGVASTLTFRSHSESYTDPSRGIECGHILNERFVTENRKRSLPVIPVTILTDSVRDRVTGEILAKHVNVESGYGNLSIGADTLSAYKFWLGQGPCDKGASSRGEFAGFAYSAKTMGVEVWK